MLDCLIIGAGMAGLMAARTLQEAGQRVLLLDKGRGVGGRMATRRLDAAVFDHGAQFFTTRNPQFAAQVAQWVAEGAAVEWCKGFTLAGDGHARYRGVGGMAAVPKYLGRQLPIHTSTPVVRIELMDNQWLATTAEGASFSAPCLLLTPPVPQSLALLDAGNVQLPLAGRNALETIEYAPCFAVLATLATPSRVPPPGGVQVQDSPSVVWIGDNQQKGVSPHPAVTIHATAEFSRQHFDAPYEQVADLLLGEAEVRGWLERAAVQTVQVHRWRYAQPTVLHPERYLLLDEPAPLAFAGDAFFEARVEGAALSGTAVAGALAGLPRRR